jgi:hypothetical protein
VGEQVDDPLLGEAGEVGSGGIEFALEVVAFAGELVAFGEEVLVLGVEAVAFVGEPGAVGLAELAEEPCGEAALGGEFALEAAGVLLSVERAFPPGGFLLGGGGWGAAPPPLTLSPTQPLGAYATAPHVAWDDVTDTPEASSEAAEQAMPAG